MNWSNFGDSVLTQGSSNLINGVSSWIGNELTWGQQKRAAKYQQQLQKDMFDYTFGKQNQREDYLNANKYIINNKALRDGGMSIAMQDGAQPQLAASSVGSSNAPNVGMANQTFNGDMSAYMLQNAQADYIQEQANNLREDTKLKKQEFEYKQKANPLSIAQAENALEHGKQDLKEKQVSYSERMRAITLQNAKTEAETKQIDESINKLLEEIQGLKIDNKYKNDLNFEQVRKLRAEVFKLAQEGKIKEVEAELANYGILVGADMFTQIAALSVKGNAKQVVELVSQMITDAVGALSDQIPNILSAVIDGVVNSVNGTTDKLETSLKDELKKIGIKTGYKFGKFVRKAGKYVRR